MFLHLPPRSGKTFKILKETLGSKTIFFYPNRYLLSKLIEYYYSISFSLPKIYLNKGKYCLKYNFNGFGLFINCNNCKYKRKNVKIFYNLIEKRLLKIESEGFLEFMKKIGICPYYNFKNINSNYIFINKYWLVNDFLFKIIRDKYFFKYIVIYDEYHNIVEDLLIFPDSLNLNDVSNIIDEIESKNLNNNIKKTLLEILYNLENGKIYFYDNIYELEKELSNNIENNKIIEVLEFVKVASLDKYKILINNSRVSLINKNFKEDILYRMKFGYKNYYLSATGFSKEFIENFLKIKPKIIEKRLELKNKFYLSEDLNSEYSNRNEETYYLYAKKIEYIYKNFKGKTLVFFPSKEFMENVMKYLDLKYIISNKVSLWALKNYDGLILTYYKGFLNEGIEIENLKNIILAGIPNLNPKFIEYIEDILGKYTKEFLFNYSFSRVLQAIGRGIKWNSNIFILDNRIFNNIWFEKLDINKYELI